MFADFIVQNHFSACGRFLGTALSNTNHCLHATLLKAFSHSSTRSIFRLFSRISNYGNILTHYLVHLRRNHELVMSDLIAHL